MQRSVSLDAVRDTAEMLLGEQRAFHIEHSGSLSNHATCVVVPCLRVGKDVAQVRHFLDAYYATIEAVPAVSPQHLISQEDLEGIVNNELLHYEDALAYFDKEIATAVQAKGRTEGLKDVCCKHIGRVSRGIGGADYHPIYELGIGIEGELPTAVATGLAYLHSRSWRDLDNHHVLLDNMNGTNSLLETLKHWTSEVSDEAFTKAPTTLNMGSQHPIAAMLTTSPVFKTVPVRVPPHNALLPAYYNLILLAAAAIPLSDNREFSVHGFASLWGLYHIVQKVPLDYVVLANLTASWLRTYFAGYLVHDNPRGGYFQLLVNCIQDNKQIVLRALKRRVHSNPTWGACLEKAAAHTNELVLKSVWMMSELAMQRAGHPVEQEILLFAAAAVPETNLRLLTHRPSRITHNINELEARSLAKQYGETWAQGRLAELDTLFTDDVVLSERPYSEEGVLKGIAAVEHHWETFLKQRNVRDITLQTVLADDGGAKAMAKWLVVMESQVAGDSEAKWKILKLTQVAILKYRFDPLHGWRVCRAEEYWQNMPPENIRPKQKLTQEQSLALIKKLQQEQKERLKYSLSEYSMQ